MMTRKQSTAAALVLPAMFALAGMGSAHAQSSAASSAAVDTFIVVVPLRPEAEITKDLELQKATRKQAQARLDRAHEEVTRIDAQIDAREKELEAIEMHIDTLDSDTKAEEIEAGKRKANLVERFRDLLELRKELREGEADAAKMTIAHTEAREEMYTSEAALAKKRNDRTALLKKPGSKNDVAALDAAIKELETEVLNKWEHALDMQKDSISEEQDVVDLLKKLAEAQAAYRQP